jgi:hypothetical protein
LANERGITVPKVTGLHPTIAKRKLEDAGLRTNMVGCSGPNCRVVGQDPEGGRRVPYRSRITCESEDVTH